ncbi:HK97 family phage major capsid protein [Pedobacter cryoconitis]|uniref:HK97 family phage major capsid protein n=2 Tax=Pedobacter cryoconitis TaxID=188932 RepID=A0A327S9I2_9SPHI|nr:HK97 family phage major capsid protein [Pedobacter cryoconitis]
MEQLGASIKEDLNKSNIELKNEIAELKTANTEFQNHLDQLSAKNAVIEAKGLSFADELKANFNSTKPELLAKGFEFQLKAVLKPQADINPEYKPGIVAAPSRKVNARQLFAVGSTGSDAVKYVRETGYTNGAAIKEEGVAAGESSFSIAQATALVKTISTYIVVSKEMLADVDGITSYLQNRVPAKMAEAEDNELFFGVGDIKGVATTAVQFTGTTFAMGTGATINQYDVLRVSANMIAKANYSATAIAINPTDKTKLELAKDSTGNYIFPYGNLSVAGIPVVETNAIPEGKFLVGDFRFGAEIKDRQGLTISYYPSDADNVKKGLITILAEERLALPVYHPGAFVTGDFTSAMVALKK